MAATRVEQTDDLPAPAVREIEQLVAAATDADGVRPVSDHVMLQLRNGGGRGARHLLHRDGDRLVGYAHLDRDGGAEVALAPAADPGVLVDVLLDEAGDRLRLWTHGGSSRLAAEARARRMRQERELLQLRRPLASPLPAPEWPEGVTVRSFVAGADETGWLTVNNRAFADHPDQSGWTLDDLLVREREPWFDPSGFFLAELDGRLVGFHWTKVHPPAGTDHEPVGEVYVIGVDPSMQGRRLGPALTLHGLHHLQAAGLTQVKLYVDESNASAIRLYERLGFTRWDTDVCFSPSGAAG